MRVLLVTTWDTACGIAEHSWYLKEAVRQADPGIDILPDPEALDPACVLARERWITTPDTIVHLNYQASLHSRWTPEAIRAVQAAGCKVVVTYHDTGVPNVEQCHTVCAAADAFVVHEPADDLAEHLGALGRGHYWRMGVPDWSVPYVFTARTSPSPALAWKPTRDHATYGFKAWVDQPVLGSIGFPFPWKHYDQLARVTASIGWALLLIAPTATDAQVRAWRALNPDCLVRSDFVPRREAIGLLAGCDATAFTYVCHNPGQSAAILQGIAARKPVIALETCRQFRALRADPLGQTAIYWIETFEDLARQLASLPIGRIDPGIVALAEQDSWRRLGQKYAELYRSLGA